MGGQATLASLLGAPSNPGAAQSQFDGKNAVPGYTLFKGKDGQSFYLKGENLSDAEVSSRVAAIRNQVNAGAPPDATTQARRVMSNNIPDRAMQQTMGGPPMFVDLPPGQGKSFEQAGQQGYQTGGMVGAGMVAGAGLAVANIGKIPGLLKSAYDWASANPVKAYLLYEASKDLVPSTIRKIFHLASGAGE